MDKNTDILHEAKRLRLLAAALELQHYTSTAANVIPLPGTERLIIIGTPAEVRALLPATIVAQPAGAADTTASASIEALRQIGQAWMGEEGRDALDDWIAATLAPVAAQQAAATAPTAWLATDQDGRGDVGFTKEEARRRAGEGCTIFFPLYDNESEAAAKAPAAQAQPSTRAVLRKLVNIGKDRALTAAEVEHFQRMIEGMEAGRGLNVSEAPTAQAVDAAGDAFAVNFIRQRAEAYLQDHAETELETGAVVFEFGEAGREYHSTLVELADDIEAALAKPGVCTAPPTGWHCTRAAGHDGPCAASPASTPETVGDVGLIRVPAHEADSYCRILSILGMEEEGDPVAEVQRLFDAEASQQAATSNEVLSYPEVVQMLVSYGGFEESQWGPENPLQYHTGKPGAIALVRTVEAEVARRLRQQAAAVAAPSGWKWVPITPTDWMIEKAASLPSNGTFNYEIYQTMVNAAPATAVAATTSEDARANKILRELVELRDLKADYDKVPHMHHVYWMRDKLADYETRWPAAWEKATAYARNAAMDDAMRATQQEGGNA